MSFSSDSFSGYFLDSKTGYHSWLATSPAVPFKRSSIPELRCVSVDLHDDVAGILTYFENIHRHGQLEKLKISGDVHVSRNGNLPRLVDLRQWLTMSTSPKFTFEMDLISASHDDQHFRTLLAEYRRVSGMARTKCDRRFHFLYPAMSLAHPVERNDENSNDKSTDEDVGYLINDAPITKVRRRRKISITHIRCFDVDSSTF